jgi:Protein of unknown function (DUF2505)
MTKFTLNHEIRCDADTFWKVFFDKEFNERLFREALGFPEFNITEQKETETQIIRSVAGKPKMNMPGPIMKLLGDNFRYREDGTFDKATRVWRWKMVPSVLTEKIRQEGILRVEPAGEGKVRRIADVTMEAKIFGIGGLMESASEKQFREGFDKSAEFMNQWVTKK